MCKLTAELSNSSWHAASQLDLVNPLSLGWELVPFSFVLDWFIPVGNMLEALTAHAGLVFVGGHYSYVTRGRKRFDAIPYWWGTPWGSPWKVGSVEYNVYGFDRVPLYDWPMPLPYADMTPFSTTRSLSALALWRTNIKRV